MGKKYDGRKTDAWALGVVLFSLVTGVLPFVEDEKDPRGRKGYLLRIAKAEYRWPTGEGEDTRLVTTAVKDLVGKLLVRDPEKRVGVEALWEMAWMSGEGRVERESGWISAKEEGEEQERE